MLISHSKVLIEEHSVFSWIHSTSRLKVILDRDLSRKSAEHESFARSFLWNFNKQAKMLLIVIEIMNSLSNKVKLIE